MSELDVSERELPPASFEFLVQGLIIQAQMNLGLFQFEDAPPADLRMAKHAIDLLAVLEEKTKGNLSLDEQRLVENALTELRFRYVQANSNIIVP